VKTVWKPSELTENPRDEYIINDMVQKAIPCSQCGGPTISARSVFLPGTMVLKCLNRCADKLYLGRDT